ncbi:hypothetical protein Mtc_1413 [Methanocella conradii HZ254]|uniref:DUF7982 domain-containing protein n=1 Tax=Methanocella conradii (strain DSM 24694 / JCM 17849 / CGMCC 1.5162 / HZ254) TaxID=1041930 RepID=H8I4I8_METCZ|nr:hypothetical protein Mtc_1413 [Methanocella conradii HZ254]
MADSVQNRIKGFMRSGGMSSIAMAFALFGAVLLIMWWATNDGSTMSMLMALSAISIILLSIMLFFFSPYTYIRDDICDSMMVSNLLSLNSMLSSLLVVQPGIYAPVGNDGAIKVFIPASSLSDEDVSGISPGVDVFYTRGSVKGISLLPPGYGLFRNAVEMGAVFTGEGLEGEIKDVLENGMELASLSVSNEGDRVTVLMRNMANAGLCNSIRKADPAICTRMGCPICSSIACMLVSGTGRKVRIEKVEDTGKALMVTFRLF